MKFESITINDGLSQGMINCIIQDHYGFMWFATKDGLNRFDGKNFKIYRHNPNNIKSIADNFIEWIFEDSKGQLWIGTSSEGVDLMDRNTETFLHFKQFADKKNTAPDNHINQIAEDKNGNIWFRTPSSINKIIAAKNKIEIVDSSGANFLFSSSLHHVYWVKNNTLFVAKNDNNNFEKINLFTSLSNSPNQSVYSIVEDSSAHQLFLVGSDCYFIFNELNNQLQYFEKNAKQLNINFPLQWFRTNNSLNLYDKKSKKIFQMIADDERMNQCLRNICYSYTDKSGNVWVGSKGYGLLKCNLTTEKFHHLESGFSIGFMRQVGNKNDVLIYKNQTNQYSIFNVEKNLFIPHDYSKRQYNGMSTDQNGNLFWQFHNKEITEYKVATKSFSDFSTNGNFEFPIYTDGENHVWYSNGKAFCCYKQNEKKTVEYDFPCSAKNIPYRFLQTIYKDGDGNFWLGTQNGLLFFNPKKIIWQQYKNITRDSTSLSFDIIFSICPDPNPTKKYLWIATNGGGLNRFEMASGKAKRYSSENSGLPNNVIYGIVNDDENNLWMSTNNGISKFNPANNQFKNFDLSDGLQSKEFNREAFCKAGSFIFFGGVNGFNYFNPKELKENKIVPSVLITDFKIRNQSVSFLSANSTLSKPVYLTNKIELNYADNVFSFEFAAMDFTATEKNLFQYKLEGFDKNWILSDKNATATYTNLDPGEYIFKVKGANNDRVWNETPVEVKIIIHPPWYLTWWFKLLIFISIISIAYSFYRMKLNQALKLQYIRNKIASDLHDEIGSTLSSISLYGEVAQKMVKDESPKASSLLTLINKNTADMMEAMSDIVWALNSKNDMFDNVINKIRAFAVDRLEPLHCELDMQVHEDVHLANMNMEQRKNLYLIFKEAINNAAKYSKCKKIAVDISITKKILTLKITDDGIGFNTALESNGNGLDNMKKRAKELKGNLSIVSSEMNGAVVKLIFPL